MAISHVRARCKTTGHVAAISERALENGVFPDWERVDGPVPERPKFVPQAWSNSLRRSLREHYGAANETADDQSAEEEE